MNNNRPDATRHGIATLTGDPKKAIIKLSIPMIIAMSAQTLYNVADTIWVSGLGADALAATGFFFPFNMLFIAISSGISVGAGSAISRAIGAKNQAEADDCALHGLFLTLVVGVLLAVLFTILARPLFIAMKAGTTLEDTVKYGQIMFMGFIITFFQGLASTYLRSEGDAKRAMNVMLLGAVLNIILDPFFIYSHPFVLSPTRTITLGLGWGVAGAAIATVVSLFLSSLPLVYWLFIKKNTYISFHFHSFRMKLSIIGNILSVGIPAFLSQASMFVMMLFITVIVRSVGGTNGVAVFTTGWRIVMVAILPLIGISMAVISVCAAAFGARDYEKLSQAYTYSIRFSLILQILISAATFIFAPWISRIFTWSPSSAMLHTDLVQMNRILCFYYPLVPFSMHTASMFQGIRRGLLSLVITFIRTILLALPFAALFALVFKQGLAGVWTGLTIGNILTGVLGIVWGLAVVRKLKAANSTAGTPAPLPSHAP